VGGQQRRRITSAHNTVMAQDFHQDIHLRENPVDNSSPRVKQPPQIGKIPVPFFYAPSDDGTDENILILLHGLGKSCSR
jgi:hypothetical protein